MGKPVQKQKKLQKKATGVTKVNYLYVLIILLYGFITVFTPNLYSFDSNGPKFLTLASLNLLIFLLLFTQQWLKKKTELLFLFFRNRIGIIYFLFLVFTLLSFIKAYNFYESIICFSKIFSVFTAAYLLTTLLRYDKRYVTILASALSILLVFDGFTVFYHVFDNVMAGKGPSIASIKSVYSNKNILAASIFVKLPFALWLFSFKKRWLRILGIVSFFVGLLGTLFMSTRSFYLGSVILFLVYLPIMGVNYSRRNEKRRFAYVLISVGIVILVSLLFFNYAIKYFYPKSQQDRYTVDFFSKMKAIGQGEPLRVASWERSLKLIKEDPLLGVGSGNWKVDVLKYENPIKSDYVYQYKAHNDFIEITAESGIIAGLLYLSIFLLIGYNFIRAFFKKDASEESYILLFLPAFGLFCYTFDAFFNFPLDRPELGSLFAIYVAAGIAFSTSRQPVVVSQQSGGPNPQPSTIPHPTSYVPRLTSHVPRRAFLLILLFLPLLVASVIVLIINFNSLHIQRLAKEDLMYTSLTQPTDFILQGYPLFPNLSMEAEPIVVSKARYLFRDKKYEEALVLLKADRSSPYDTRPDFFIANAYFSLNNVDSALVYNYKVYRYKPLFFNNILNICRILEMKKRYPEAIGLVETYCAQTRTIADGYLFGAALCDNGGYLEKAVSLLDSGRKYIPDNGEIIQQSQLFYKKLRIKQFGSIYDKAVTSFQQKNYPQAIRFYSDFIARAPEIPDAYMTRAFCYQYVGEYKNSLADIDYLFTIGIRDPALINLRGVNYHMMGDDETACRDFQEAMGAGNKDAAENFARFCRKGVK